MKTLSPLAGIRVSAFVVGLVVLAGTVLAQGTVADGWTTPVASPDTRTVYVSSALGNDANSGLSTTTPKRTLAAGYALMRSGYPDWLLLKRGDSWDEAIPSWAKSGRSATEPMVVWVWGSGTARPQVRPGTAIGFSMINGPTSNVTVMGLRITPRTYLTNGLDGDAGGVRIILNGGGNLLFEDLLIENAKDGMVFQGFNGAIQTIRVHRCVVVDSYASGTSHSEGLYAAFVNGITIDECIFDHNGWLDGVAPATIFNHNIYIDNQCANATVTGNIIANGSSHGLQLRPGGVCSNNLLVRNALAVMFGGGDAPNAGGVSGSFTGNVILECRDIDAANPRGWGLELKNIGGAGVTVEDNIIAHKISSNTDGTAIRLSPDSYGSGVGIIGAWINNNVVYDWHGSVEIGAPTSGRTVSNIHVTNNIVNDTSTVPLVNAYAFPSGAFQFSANRYQGSTTNGAWFGYGGSGMTFNQWQPYPPEANSVVGMGSFPDPNVSIARYNGTLGGAATYDAFMATARTQSRSGWNTNYTATAATNYIRAGFGRGGTTLPGCPGDIDGNGRVDINDYVAFQTLFIARSSRADVNHDGAWNIQDFVTYQGLAATGCP